MTYLTLFGHIPTNKGLLGSRGYHVFRQGTAVTVIWGRVNARHGRTVSIEWAGGTQQIVHRHRTEADAEHHRRRIVAEQLAQGYSRLPAGTRIKRPSGVGNTRRN